MIFKPTWSIKFGVLKYEHNGVKPAQWCATYLPTIVENDKADFLGGQLLTYGEDYLSLLL